MGCIPGKTSKSLDDDDDEDDDESAELKKDLEFKDSDVTEMMTMRKLRKEQKLNLAEMLSY